MRSLSRALLGALLACAAGPLQAQPAASPPVAGVGGVTNRIVAVVNGDIVTQGDVDGRRRLFAINAGLPVAPEVLNRLTPQVIRLLVDERLRFQEAQRRRAVVSDEDLAGAVQELERRNNLPPGGLVAQLRRAGVEPRVLYDQLRTQIAWSRLIRAMLGAQGNVSEADVAEFIAAQKARTGQPEYLVSEIFIPVDEPGEEAEVRRFTEEVITQLRGGIPFPVAATQFSQSQTALTGGDLGWVGAEALDPAVADVVTRMPPGAVSNPIRVPGGFQIVALRQRREVGRDIATIVTLRQAFMPFTSPLDPSQPTPQQIETLQRAQALSASARSCQAVEQANRSERAADPGPVRLENVQPPQLRQLLAGLQPGRASQPVVSPDGIAVIMVCSKETRNEGEITPEIARAQLLRDRAELVSRQMQRDLRRRAQIEMRQG